MAIRSRQAPITIGELPDDEIKRVAWWYCGIYKNPKAPSEPRVEICFQTLMEDGSLGNFTYYKIGLTHLGQVRLGTIWQGKHRVGQIPLEEVTYQLNFDDDGWKMAAPWDKEGEKSYLIPPWAYSLPSVAFHRPTHLIQFHITGDPKGLLIPCLELFSRTYGHSQYVKRVLLNNNLAIAKEKLYVPDIEPAPDGVWQVTVEKHAHNSDAIFLAHLKHDPVTEQRVKRIWGDAEAAQGVSGEKVLFLAAAPYFSGPAQLRVRGIWLTPQKRFLGLQIIGCSDPGGAPVFLDRENTNLTGPLQKIASGPGWPKKIKPNPEKNKEILLTHLEEPGANQEAMEIEDPEIRILGMRRKVVRVRRQATGIREPRYVVSDEPPEKHSGGEAHGDNPSVVPASINAERVLESQGTLRDIWSALQQLTTGKDAVIKKLASVTPEGKLSYSSEPVLLPLKPLGPKVDVSGSIRNWPFLDPASQQLRGVLVAWVETNLGAGYFLEIERRTAPDENGGVKESESYKGMVFRLEDEEDLAPWLATLLEDIVYAKGILDKIKDNCPGEVDTFVHRHTTDGSLDNAVQSGLEKIGLV